jgi:hypothetical protein
LRHYTQQRFASIPDYHYTKEQLDSIPDFLKGGISPRPLDDMALGDLPHLPEEEVLVVGPRSNSHAF